MYVFVYLVQLIYINFTPPPPPPPPRVDRQIHLQTGEWGVAQDTEIAAKSL
jgi:hypothetical protein